MIGISKSIEYYNDDPYNIDVFLQGDSTMSDVTLQLHDGSDPIVLENNGSDRYRTEIIFYSSDELCAFPGCDYV